MTVVERTPPARSTGTYARTIRDYGAASTRWEWGYTGGRRNHPPHAHLRGWGGSATASQAGITGTGRRR